MKHRRMKPEVRKQDILERALTLAGRHGYLQITRKQIVDAVGVSGPVLNHHFGTMTQFRRQLMRFAIAQNCLAVVAQGLAAGDPQARKAPESLRQRAAASLLSSRL